MIDAQKLLKAVCGMMDHASAEMDNKLFQRLSALEDRIEHGEFDTKQEPTKNQSITLTRTICPTCGRILIEAWPKDVLIMRCQNCGDLFRVYSNGAIPMLLTKWQEKINVPD